MEATGYRVSNEPDAGKKEAGSRGELRWEGAAPIRDGIKDKCD